MGVWVHIFPRLHQKSSRGACSLRSTRLLLADLHQVKTISFAEIFEISGRNPGLGLELMI